MKIKKNICLIKWHQPKCKQSFFKLKLKKRKKERKQIYKIAELIQSLIIYVYKKCKYFMKGL